MGSEVAGGANRPLVITESVLIVDDNPEDVQALRDVLTERGYYVRTAKDGGQAQSSFSMHRPDFVILDLILPGESGFELCERLKERDETVPILVLSVIDMEDARDLARRVGADGFLTKPFDPEELLATVSDIASRTWERHHEEPAREQRIRFQCKCGKRFKVSPVHRGRTMTCPDCGEPLVVPRHK